MNLLFIGTTWPERNATAAGVRAWAMLDAFTAAGWKLHFATPASENTFTEELRALGHSASTILPNDSRFDDLLKTFKPDIVLFDRFPIEEQFSWRVQTHAPGALRVLDTVDLHFVRRNRQAECEVTGKVTLTQTPSEPTTDMLRELSAIHRSDLTLVCSKTEIELLATLGVPASLIHHTPLLYPRSDFTRADFRDRNHFVTIGNFRHQPNADGVLWLKQEIWPLIRSALPAQELHVYGAYPSQQHMELNCPREGFFVKGPAKDQLATLSRYRVNLAPLRFGAGLKGKIADGWFARVPCVSTSVGAEGMRDRHGRFGGMVSDDARAFAESAILLHTDQKISDELADLGHSHLHSEYSASEQTRRLVDRISASLHELPALRQRNLTGAMLWLHAHRSTEYFSRWIELKNAR